VSEFFDKVRWVYRQGRLGSAVALRVKPYALGLKHLVVNPAGPRITIHAPSYVTPPADPAEMAIVSRIFQSFAKMKADQATAPPAFLPASLWQKQLDLSYANLLEGLQHHDISRFHFFLANFGAWETYHGIEANTMIRDYSRSLVRRRYLTNVVFLKQLEMWTWFHGGRRPIESLTYPRHGNQSGAFIDGVFVGAGSFFSEVYGSMLANLVSDRRRPVVADLGGGYGKLAYFALRDLEQSCFIDFDLPETLCLAAYYWMKSFPEKRILLYGEAEYSSAAHEQYDAIFMPSYEIVKLAPQSVDLFMNKNSLGEMTRESVHAYIEHIARATRYFFHMNHDRFANIYDDRKPGLLAHEYPVPLDQFKLLFRYPDIGHLLGRGGVDFGMDIFLYLYERRASA
jgi:hypothetical protein